jgi:hypothetical protein
LQREGVFDLVSRTVREKRGPFLYAKICSHLNMNDLDIDLPNAKLAYTIIQSLLEGHEALSDLLVVMSHALDEDTLKALTATAEWQNYMDSKRTLENTKEQIERFTEELKRLETPS